MKLHLWFARSLVIRNTQLIYFILWCARQNYIVGKALPLPHIDFHPIGQMDGIVYRKASYSLVHEKGELVGVGG